MNTAFSQITVRGLDEQTKRLLEKKAAGKGVSMNSLAVEALRQAAGTDGAQTRYQKWRDFFNTRKISQSDLTALDDAVAWMDAASKTKNERDQHESGL